jgi:hypothetical protein
MSIVSLTPYYVGQVNQLITRWKLVCTDSLAVLTTAGYLNTSNLMGYKPSPNDIFDVIYLYTGSINQLGTGTYTECTPTVVYIQGVATYTLNQVVDAGNIPLPTLPVVSTDLVVFSGTAGAVADSGVLLANVMQKNIVNTMAAGSSIVLAKVNGTEAANAVTANGVAGYLTTSALTTAGAGTYVITWTNTFISTTSVIGLTIQGGTNTTQNVNFKVVAGAGTATLTIYNLTAATALNGTIIIGYSVL